MLRPTAHCCRLPIHAAATAGHAAVVEALLHSPYGCESALVQDKAGRAQLSTAAAEGHTDIVAMLLAAAPETITVCCTEGRSALHFAAAGRHLATVQALLAGPGAGTIQDTSCSSEGSSTALHWAVSHGCSEADVCTILEADPSAARKRGGDDLQTPLQVRPPPHAGPCMLSLFQSPCATLVEEMHSVPFA